MFHCLVIKVFRSVSQTARLFYLISFCLSSTFFKFFSNIFELRFCCRFVDDLDTLSYLLSFVNCWFHFSEILFWWISVSLTACLLYHVCKRLSTSFFIFLKSLFFSKKLRRRRDLNPRAALATYTLSRGTSSASWVLLQTPNL